MRTLSLSEAQQARKDLLLEQEIDRKVDLALSAKNVSPSDKKKLSGLLKYYAKKKRPFTACVRDNTKRFGRKGAERVCATLKDIIRGTTKWRKGGKHDRGTKGLSQEYLLVDHDMPHVPDDVLDLIEQLSDEEILEIVTSGGDD